MTDFQVLRRATGCFAMAFAALSLSAPLYAQDDGSEEDDDTI